jgi:predicted MFS family arabinose efflux permease
MRKSNWPLILSAGAATCSANLSWFLQPLIVSDLMVSRHVSVSSAALLVTFEFIAITLTSFLLARFVHDVRFRAICAAGGFLMVAGSLATLLVHGYAVTAVARSLTGIGEGVFLMVSTAAVARLADPDRAYAQLNVVNIICGAIVSLGLPPLVDRFGSQGLTLKVIAAMLTAFAVISLAMPRTEIYVPPKHAGRGGSISARVLLIAVASFFLALGTCATWAVYVTLGLNIGLAEVQIDRIISYAVLSAIPAGMLATFLGARFGRLLPMSIATATIICSIFVLATSHDHLLFAVFGCLNQAGMCFLVPYMFGVAAKEDSSGRAAAITGAAYLMTGAVGPTIAGALIDFVGVWSIAWFVLAVDGGAILLFAWILRSGGPKVDGHLVQERDGGIHSADLR